MHVNLAFRVRIIRAFMHQYQVPCVSFSAHIYPFIPLFLLQGNKQYELIHKQKMGDAYAYIASDWLSLVIDTYLEHFQMGQGNCMVIQQRLLKTKFSAWCQELLFLISYYLDAIVHPLKADEH